MNKFTLPSSLDINCVTAVHVELLAAIDSGAPLTIDGADVDYIDTTGLQLLLVLCLHAKRVGQTILISDSSAAMQAAFCLSGLKDTLDKITERGVIE